MSLPTTVAGVLARMREIDADLAAPDGVAVFNRMYLTVTERIAAIIADPADRRLAVPGRGDDGRARRPVRLPLAEGVRRGRRGRTVPPAWRALFEARTGGRVPIQYAIAGMNSHIEHDLPIAVVDTCKAHGLDPDDVHQDYEAVNDVLAEVEAPIRRSFLDEVGRDVDDHFGPVVHLVSAWNIDKARDLSWVTVETLWALRHTSFLRGRFLDGLGHTVGMASRALLTPTR